MAVCSEILVVSCFILLVTITNALERQRRYLIFTPATQFGTFVTVSMPMPEPNNLVNVAWFFEANYYNVDNSSYFDPLLGDIVLSRSREKRDSKQTEIMTRSLIYKIIEGMLRKEQVTPRKITNYSNIFAEFSQPCLTVELQDYAVMSTEARNSVVRAYWTGKCMNLLTFYDRLRPQQQAATADRKHPYWSSMNLYDISSAETLLLAECCLRHGYPGRGCLLRSICETATTHYSHNGLIGDVLHLILTPSLSQDEEDLQDCYYEAEYLGLDADCKKYNNICPHNLLDDMSMYIDHLI